MIDWGYCAGRLRSLENNLLTYNELLRWSESSNIESFAKNIGDSIYADSFTNDNLDKYDEVFEEHLLSLYAEIKNYIPNDNLLKIHRLVYDTNNMKIILKAKLVGADVKWEFLSENGDFAPEELFTMIEEKQYSKFAQPIAEALTATETEYRNTGNLQLVDLIIDSGVNNYRFELLDSEAYKNIRNYYAVWVDMENIKNLLRAKKMDFDKILFLRLLLQQGRLSIDFFDDIYAENINDIAELLQKTAYGEFLADGLREFSENKNFTLLEKLMDEYLAKSLIPFTYVAQGPEVLEEFISLKKLEVKNLKILFSGLLNDIPAEKIKQRIRNNAF